MTSVLQARAAVELRARRAEGHGVAVIIQDGDLWRYRGQWLTHVEAAAFRKSFRGKLIIVNRSPAPMLATAADASFPVSAYPYPIAPTWQQ